MSTDFEKLHGMAQSGALEPYIRHIRFPRFKNLEDGLRIEFTYPITALVGPNGTNKSSILRALQGCPDSYNIGNSWFSTSLDPDMAPNRYIHGYRVPSGSVVEVIKSRVDKAGRTEDYFETSAPRRRDQMAVMPERDATPATDQAHRNKTRWAAVKKDVHYIDFRQELPAYDIQFYFNWRGKKNSPADKKRMIRQRATHVATALNELEKSHDYYRKNRILEPAEQLQQADVDMVSEILGRKYSSIRLVKHDLFEAEGYTAKLETDHLSYSEAFAGSGEFAAIMLVRTLAAAKDHALVLIDEPEVSLHPGAQRNLVRAIAKIAVSKKLQVVIATHSPSILEELPPAAIKILDFNTASGRVQILAQEASPSEAFNRIGATVNKREIYVEDDLAAAIIERAAKLKNYDFAQTIKVIPLVGGAQTILTRIIPSLAVASSNALVILDGDQRPALAIRDSQTVSDAELEAELAKLGIGDKHILRNGGSGDGDLETLLRRRQVLKWINAHLRFLPGRTPEELLCALIEVVVPLGANPKGYWVKATARELDSPAGELPKAREILATQQRALARVRGDNRYVIDILGSLILP
ncbi:ATP-dependent nuclease [Cryobacterium lyxosi]|nr:AAA family ATPase [Cryobacterium lyxosi]